MDIGVGTGATALEQKLKVIMRTAHGNPMEAFGEMEVANMETLEKTDNKSNILGWSYAP